MQTMTIIRGLPGSGKSTIARRLAQETNAVHLEADMFFETKSGKYEIDRTLMNEAHQWCKKWCDLHLANGRSIIVANTFVQKWELLDYLYIALKHGVNVDVFKAKGNFSNVHGVPPETVERMRSQWEDLDEKQPQQQPR